MINLQKNMYLTFLLLWLFLNSTIAQNQEWQVDCHIELSKYSIQTYEPLYLFVTIDTFPKATGLVTTKFDANIKVTHSEEGSSTYTLLAPLKFKEWFDGSSQTSIPFFAARNQNKQTCFVFRKSGTYQLQLFLDSSRYSSNVVDIFVSDGPLSNLSEDSSLYKELNSFDFSAFIYEGLSESTGSFHSPLSKNYRENIRKLLCEKYPEAMLTKFVNVILPHYDWLELKTNLERNKPFPRTKILQLSFQLIAEEMENAINAYPNREIDYLERTVFLGYIDALAHSEQEIKLRQKIQEARSSKDPVIVDKINYPSKLSLEEQLKKIKEKNKRYIEQCQK